MPIPLSFFVALLHAQTQTPVTQTQTAQAQPAQVVYAEPNPALPGQAVTIHWPASLGRVAISGGGFGSHKEFKGQTSAQDHPSNVTTYNLASVAKSKSKQPPKRYTLLVDVYQGLFPKLATYSDTRGWSMDVIAGWNRYAVDLPDAGNNELVYFEPQEDSVERTAVSILPVNDMDAMQLMRKVETEIPTQYDMLTRTGLKETTQCGLKAAWMTFTGTDVSHPDTPSKSMVIAFVKGTRGYVISARTSATGFDNREQLLRCLIRSFAFLDHPVPPRKPAPPTKTAPPHK
jgi:hypothetical protein